MTPKSVQVNGWSLRQNSQRFSDPYLQRSERYRSKNQSQYNIQCCYDRALSDLKYFRMSVFHSIELPLYIFVSAYSIIQFSDIVCPKKTSTVKPGGIPASVCIRSLCSRSRIQLYGSFRISCFLQPFHRGFEGVPE